MANTVVSLQSYESGKAYKIAGKQPGYGNRDLHGETSQTLHDSSDSSPESTGAKEQVNQNNSENVKVLAKQKRSSALSYHGNSTGIPIITSDSTQLKQKYNFIRNTSTGSVIIIKSQT